MSNQIVTVITQLYTEESLSAKEISTRIGMSRATVIKRLKEAGIRIRTSGESRAAAADAAALAKWTGKQSPPQATPPILQTAPSIYTPTPAGQPRRRPLPPWRNNGPAPAPIQPVQAPEPVEAEDDGDYDNSENGEDEEIIQDANDPNFRFPVDPTIGEYGINLKPLPSQEPIVGTPEQLRADMDSAIEKAKLAVRSND